MVVQLNTETTPHDYNLAEWESKAIYKNSVNYSL